MCVLFFFFFFTRPPSNILNTRRSSEDHTIHIRRVRLYYHDTLIGIMVCLRLVPPPPQTISDYQLNSFHFRIVRVEQHDI